jgi:hypothetical protein
MGRTYTESERDQGAENIQIKGRCNRRIRKVVY